MEVGHIAVGSQMMEVKVLEKKYRNPECRENISKLIMGGKGELCFSQ